MNPLAILPARLVEALSSPVPLLLAKVTLLLAAAWLFHTALRSQNPRWRVLVWRLTAVGCVLLAGLAACPPLFEWSVLTAADAGIADADAKGLSRVDSQDAPQPTAGSAGSTSAEQDRAARQGPVRTDVAETNSAVASSPPIERSRTAARQPSSQAADRVAHLGWAWWALLVWSVVVVVLALRTMIGMLRVRAICRRAARVNHAVAERAAQIGRDLGLSRAAGATSDARRDACPTIRESPDVPTPCLVGLWRPVILLPASPNFVLDGDELTAVLAHELAHVRGRDLPWNALLHALAHVLWFHPLAWRVRASHASACDAVCDLVAADYLGDTAVYTRTLARLAVRVASPVTTAGLAMARSSSVRRRIDMLRRGACHPNLSNTSFLLLSTVVLALVTTLGTGGIAQTQSKSAVTQATFEPFNAEARQQEYGGPEREENAEGGRKVQLTELDQFGDNLPQGAIARLGTTLFRHRSNVYAVAISPDSTLVASSSRDGEIRLWETDTGRLLYIFRPDRALPVQAIAFSPDGRYLAAGSSIVLPPLPPGESFGSWWLWDVESGKVAREVHFSSREGDEAQAEDRGESDDVTGIAFSPDGGKLATGHKSGDVRVWDPLSGEELLTLPSLDRENDSAHPKLVFSPDGTLLALARGLHRRPDIEIWSLETEENTFTLKTNGAEEVVSLTFDPNGIDLIAGYRYYQREETAAGTPYLASRGKVLIWDTGTGGEPREFPELDAGVQPSMALSQSGKMLAVAARDGIALWDFGARRPIRTLQSPHRQYLHQVQALAISLTGDRIVAATHHGGPVVFVWDTQTGQLLPEGFASLSRVSATGFFAGDAKIATKDRAGFLRTWNAQTGEPILNKEPTFSVDRGWSISQTGTVIKAPSNSLQDKWFVEFWDANTGARRGHHAVPGEVSCTAISADGRLAAAAYGNSPHGYGGSPKASSGIQVWNSASGEQIAELALPQTAVALSFAFDRPVLFYVVADKQFWSLLSWNYQTDERRTVIEELQGVGFGLSSSIVFSQDATVLAACTTELLPERKWRTPAVVHVYDLTKKTRRLPIEVPRTVSNVLAISRDNRMLATAGVQVFSPTQEFDEAIYLWDLQTGEQIKKVGLPDAGVTAMDFSSDGRRLVTATAMGTALVWDVD